MICASCLRLCRIDLHPPPLVRQHRNRKAGQVINVFAHQLPMRQFPKNLCCCFGKMHCSLLYNHLHFLARLLNVVAYNAPDAPYVPLLHPVAGLLLEAGLNEEEVNTSKRSRAKILSPGTGPRGLLRPTSSPHRSHIRDTIPSWVGHS